MKTKVLKHGTRLAWLAEDVGAMEHIDSYEPGHCERLVEVARNHQFRDTGTVDKKGETIFEAAPNAWSHYYLQPVTKQVDA